MARTPFKLRSSGPFKMMGSSPARKMGNWKQLYDETGTPTEKVQISAEEAKELERDKENAGRAYDNNTDGYKQDELELEYRTTPSISYTGREKLNKLKEQGMPPQDKKSYDDNVRVKTMYEKEMQDASNEAQKEKEDGTLKKQEELDANANTNTNTKKKS
ncbi:MAG TPA: hypothetical protein DCG56_05725 [Flavobacteriaceae bacterium]|jgi:hypothetical protein|nr:hypothetical protein [Flavobacteriaceae bacterium]